MRAVLALLLIASSGCDLGFDFELDLSPKTIDVTSDNFRLTVAGCVEDGLFGCSADESIDDQMAVVLDGLRYPVPQMTPDPNTIVIFPDRSFRLVTEVPDDPRIGVALSSPTVFVEELPWFDVELASDRPVVRGEGWRRFDFDTFPGADVSAHVETTCGTSTTQYRDAVAAVDIHADGYRGYLEVAFVNPKLVGTCSHSLNVLQTVRIPNEIDASIQVHRRVHQTFASTP